MDWAIIRGKVVGDPQYIKNGGEVRCQFSVGVELSKVLLTQDVKTPVKEFVFTNVLATTEPSLTERCRALLDKGDDVLVMGEFGFHKGRLKMRVRDIDLPDVTTIASAS